VATSGSAKLAAAPRLPRQRATGAGPARAQRRADRRRRPVCCSTSP